MKTDTTYTLRKLLVAYAFGFLFCWATLCLGYRQSAHYRSLLFWALLGLQAHMLEAVNALVAIKIQWDPPSLYGPTTITSSALVALLFPLAIGLFFSGKRALRWSGLGLCMILVFLGLIWFPTPKAF